MPRRTRATRWRSAFGRLVGWTVLLLVACVSLAGVALRTSVVKARLAPWIADAVSSSIPGTLVIEQLGDITLNGSLGPSRVRFLDPRGQLAFIAEGLHARIELWPLLRSLFDDGPLEIRIPNAQLQHVDFALGYDGTSLAVARVFEPPEPEAPTPSEGPMPVAVSIDGARIDHAWVHGTAPALGPVDLELRDVSARLSVRDEAVDLRGVSARWQAREVTFGLRARGDLAGSARFPLDDSPMSARVTGTGKLDDAPFSLAAELHDGQYTAYAALPQVDPVVVRHWVPATQPANLSLAVTGTFAQAAASVRAAVGNARVRASAGVTFANGSAQAHATFTGVDLAVLTAEAPATKLTGSLDAKARNLFDEGRRIRGRLHLDRSLVADFRLPTVDAAFKWSHDVLFAAAELMHDGIRAEFRGAVHLNRERVIAEATAKASDWAQNGIAVRRASVAARASGSLDDPRIEGQAQADVLTYDEWSLRDVSAEVRGTQRALDVSVEAESEWVGHVNARARVDLARLGIRKLFARIRRDQTVAELRARAIDPSAGGVEIDGLRVTGIGQLEASGRLRGGRFALTASGKALRLSELGTLLRIPNLRGTVTSVDADLSGHGGTVQGRFAIVARNFGMANVNGLDVDVWLETQGGKLSGDATLTAEEDIVQISARELTLSSLAASADQRWQALHGILEVNGRVHLERVAAWLPSQALGESLAGTMTFGMRATGEGDLPAVDFAVSTDGLTLSEDVGMGGIRGLDARVRGRLSARDRTVRLRAEILDDKGVWIYSSGTLEVPTPIQSMEAKGWLGAPLDVSLAVNPRRLGELPRPLSSLPIDGTFSGRIRAEGHLGNPRVFVDARLHGVETPSEWSTPFDTYVLARYSTGTAQAWVHALQRGQPLAAVQLHVNGTPEQLATGSWTGRARAELHGLQLSNIAWLAGYDVHGRAFGHATIEKRSDGPRADAEVDLRALRVGRTQFRAAKATASVDTEELQMTMKLTQRDGGSARATFRAQVDRSTGSLAPDIDMRSAEFELRARSLRPGFALPFMGDVLTKLDGRIDANLKLQPGAERSLSGNLRFSDGVLQTPAVGQTLHDIEMQAVAKDGQLVVERFTGRGLQGRFSAQGSVRLEGLAFEEAQATLRIPDDAPMPFTLEGVSYGKASGKIEVHAAQLRNDDLVVDVAIPRFELALPPDQAGAAQSLDAAPHILTGYHEQSGRFTELPLQLVEDEEQAVEETNPTKTTIRIRLGKDVSISRANQLEARFDGSTEFRIQAGEVQAEGQLRLQGGWLDVMGKRFVVEEGTVTLQENDLANPVIVAAAHWEASDGTLVRAEFRGPAQTGTLELSSNPPLADGAILSLLVLGTTEGSTAGETGESGAVASGAAQVGGALVTRGLDSALTALTNLEISTRIDTSENTPSPEVRVRITPRLAVEVAYVPDSTTPTGRRDTALLTFSFTLPKSWLLETTVGDAGTSILDLIWRHRY